MNFMNLFQNDIKAVFPEIFLTTAILVLLVYGVVYNSTQSLSTESTESSTPPFSMTHIIAFLSLQTLLITLLLVINNPLSSLIVLKNQLILDHFTSFVKMVVLFSCAACILLSISYLRDEKLNSFEYFILMLLATLGMILMASSYDFLSMYLALELQSLSLYVMAAFKRQAKFSTEAGLKYFLLGAFSSGILLFGCSMIYGFTGTTNFGELAIILSGLNESPHPIASHGILIGVVFVAVSLLFKLAAVPFHMWAPDVYEGSPTSVTAFFAITPKIAVAAVFLRLFFFSFYDFMDQWQQIILFSSIFSMIFAALAALYQNKIKRLFAYSAIGHIGYILIGFATGSTLGLQALLIYLVVYILMTINTFGVILSLRRTSDGQQVKEIPQLAHLSSLHPMLAMTFAISLFSTAGIPPLAGFYSKLYLFFAAVESQLYLLAVIGVLTTVISCVYYIRIVKIMYFDSSPIPTHSYQTMDKPKSLVVAATAFFILFFFVHPTPLFMITHQAALTLCL